MTCRIADIDPRNTFVAFRRSEELLKEAKTASDIIKVIDRAAMVEGPDVIEKVARARTRYPKKAIRHARKVLAELKKRWEEAKEMGEGYREDYRAFVKKADRMMSKGQKRNKARNKVRRK